MMERCEQVLYDDAIDLLCGKQIGSGMSRRVFECTILPGYVVKVEKDISSFQNIREFEVWDRIQYTDHSKWFAKIHTMSANGRILIMERTYPPGLNEWPEKIPAYLTDVKKDNFGMSMLKDPKTGVISNRFVIHDYGMHLLLENGMTKRMKKVNWGGPHES